MENLYSQRNIKFKTHTNSVFEEKRMKTCEHSCVAILNPLKSDNCDDVLMIIIIWYDNGECVTMMSIIMMISIIMIAIIVMVMMSMDW